MYHDDEVYLKQQIVSVKTCTASSGVSVHKWEGGHLSEKRAQTKKDTDKALIDYQPEKNRTLVKCPRGLLGHVFETKHLSRRSGMRGQGSKSVSFLARFFPVSIVCAMSVSLRLRCSLVGEMILREESIRAGGAWSDGQKVNRGTEPIP